MRVTIPDETKTLRCKNFIHSSPEDGQQSEGESDVVNGPCLEEEAEARLALSCI